MVVCHGNKRESTVQELAQADVVLTNYSTIRNKFHKNLMWVADNCRW